MVHYYGESMGHVPSYLLNLGMLPGPKAAEMEQPLQAPECWSYNPAWSLCEPERDTLPCL